MHPNPSFASGGAAPAVQPRAAGRPCGDQIPLVELCGWGRYPVVRGRQIEGEDLERITRDSALSRGLARSYGDASLPAGEDQIVSRTVRADRMISFDESTGVLRAEAGLSLAALNDWSLPRGWFTPVTPGTKFVTLGGMVAADVHGKNHHVNGCFGEHVAALRMRVADGRILEVTEESEPDLFRATLGGMGLTGHILEVAVRLEKIASPWIWQESEQAPDLEALIERLQAAGKTWPMTVTWSDLMQRGRHLGRGVLIRGRWAEPHEARQPYRRRSLRVAVPFDLPDFVLNPLTIGAFNQLNFWKHGGGVKRGIVHTDPFFYPLDAVHDWNRIYGRRGFTQYQCVLPVHGSLAPHRKFAERLVRGGGGYLVVIKDSGPEGKGMLSFMKPGITFAVDIPVGPDTQRLVDSLNEIVLEGGGRIYLAKDAFTRGEHYRAMDPRADRFLAVRRKWDPAGRLRSALSVRIFGE